MSESYSPESLLKGCMIRRFQPDDAARVTRLVQEVYGNSYYPPALYNPEQIAQLNQTGKLISVLALDAVADVIGHFALELGQLGMVAEASDAIVAATYRHHHLMESMHVLLREEAVRLGLRGLVGYPVTNHLFSQEAEDRFGSYPCGMAPGLWPQSFHNMPQPLTQRMSFVIYFNYLRPPEVAVYVDTPHSAILTRIAEQWGIDVRLQDGAPAQGSGELTVEHEPEVQVGTIRVHVVGADTAAAVRKARAQLVAAGAKAIALELPLAQPATAELCRDAEAAGFFFSGLGPAFGADGDALLLQFLVEDLDFSLIQIVNPFARELLDYVNKQWERVGDDVKAEV